MGSAPPDQSLPGHHHVRNRRRRRTQHRHRQRHPRPGARSHAGRRRVPGQTIRSCWPGSISPRSTASSAPIRRWPASPSNAADADSYVAQTGLVAAKLGVIDPPRSVAELRRSNRCLPARAAFDGGRHARLPTCFSTIPPIAGLERAGYAVLAAGAVSLLPPWVRVELRLPTFPITDRLLTRTVTRTALRTIRWALAGAPVDDPQPHDDYRRSGLQPVPPPAVAPTSRRHRRGRDAEQSPRAIVARVPSVHPAKPSAGTDNAR